MDMSEVFDCTTPEGLAAGIEAAARAVQSGQVVVLPTDTVYGIGCDAFDASAVTAVLAAKGRGRDMPPPVLVPNARTVDGLARSVPPYVRHLIDRFWPGALTLVLESQPSLTWDLGETNGTVALRMPDHEIALALLGQAGPMAVTSANLTGRPPAQTVAEAQEQLGAAVAVYLDGGPASGRVRLDDPRLHRRRAAHPARGRADPRRGRRGARGGGDEREAEEAARAAAVAAAAAKPPRSRAGPRIAGSRRRR